MSPQAGPTESLRGRQLQWFCREPPPTSNPDRPASGRLDRSPGRGPGVGGDPATVGGGGNAGRPTVGHLARWGSLRSPPRAKAVATGVKRQRSGLDRGFRSAVLRIGGLGSGGGVGARERHRLQPVRRGLLPGDRIQLVLHGQEPGRGPDSEGHIRRPHRRTGRNGR